jgi:hypothetical protein
MRPLSLFIVALAGLVALPALAQTPPPTPPVRIRGTIEKLDGHALTVKSRDGQSINVTLADNVAVVYLVKKSMADIKSGLRARTARSTRSRFASSPKRCAAPAKGNFPGI